MSHPAQHAFDPADPHGFHAADHGHGHVIVSWQTLTGVLLVLLAMTVLTVFQAQAEKFAAHEWGWVFPQWVNIVLAMGIAVVKGSLVVLFFMQLRYDKSVNGVIFLFTLFAVWLFLMFTMIDLSGRGSITPWRAGEVVSGGTTVGLRSGGFSSSAGSVVDQVREAYIAEHGLAAYESHLHHDDAHGPTVSTKDRTLPANGLTPGLFDSGPWLGAAKDEHADDSH
jgi:cytochrome c oxidase subunit 4